MSTLPLREATVHPDGATIVRKGTLPAPEGRLVVRGLPWLLEPGSVRVVAPGVGEVEVDVDDAGLDRAPRPALLGAVADAERALAVAQAELDGLRTERAWHQRLVPSWTDTPERALPNAAALARWARLDQRVDQHTGELDARIAELFRELRERSEALAVLRAQAAAASGAAAWQHLVPTRLVRARVAPGAEVPVELSYVVGGAAWAAAYVLEADVALSRGTFALRALVVQATGEDWTDVALRLSTAPVQRRVDVPALRSLRLAARQDAPRPAFRDLPTGFDALFPTLDLHPPEPEPPEPAPIAEALSVADLDDDEAKLDGAPRVQSRSAPAPMAPRRASLEQQAAPMRKSAGWLSASFGGGAPGAAPAAAPAPSAARLRRPDDASRRQEPDPDRPLEVDVLDYGRYRLQPFTDPPGRRGRLFPAGDEARLDELGGAEASARFADAIARLEAGRAAVGATAWPPHHVLAGPIQGYDRVFVVDGRVDLPADGAPHNVAVTRWPARLTVSYRAVPRHDPRAFRLVDAVLEGASGSLLPGPVDVRVGGRLELTTPWSGSAGRGHLRIGLGAEDRLRLARNVRYKDEAAGLFGGSRRIVTQIEVKVASAVGAPVRLELLERLPVAAERETLTVELTEQSPVADVWKGDPDGPLLAGGRCQVLEVPPGGEARAVLAYTVTLGAKDELVGGDRRG